MFSPKNVKTETPSDGWTMTFENTGSAGTNSTLTTPAQQTGALAACKSLEL